MSLILDKWNPNSPSCVTKTYLYNKVEEGNVPRYGPTARDDPKEWEEALANKPAPSYMPVLCAGFREVASRLELHKRVAEEFSRKLHAINASLDAILRRHELEHSVRALAARRRHDKLAHRVLLLGARVQVMRNRGYAPSADEDELAQKLRGLDKRMQDPALSARAEELWSRLIVLRGYADSFRTELAKQAAAGLEEGAGLGEEVEAKAKKVRAIQARTVGLGKLAWASGRGANVGDR